MFPNIWARWELINWEYSLSYFQLLKLNWYQNTIPISGRTQNYGILFNRCFQYTIFTDRTTIQIFLLFQILHYRMSWLACSFCFFVCTVLHPVSFILFSYKVTKEITWHYKKNILLLCSTETKELVCIQYACHISTSAWHMVLTNSSFEFWCFHKYLFKKLLIINLFWIL